MHICPPPTEALDAWLRGLARTSHTYGHLLLEQHNPADEALVTALRPYFESAHGDARDVFHANAAIDLHPDADGDGSHAEYPACLPPAARRGLFGEVLAGLLCESYEFIGGHDWRVPIFLFRYHADVEAYIYDLARDPERHRQVFGRFGNDFIAIALDDAGAVVRFLAGEAKWRDTITPAVMDEIMLGEWIRDPPDSENRVRSGRGVWFELSRGLPIPHGLRQLQRLLRECAPEDYGAAILSMDRAIALRDAPPLPRSDLVLVAGNAGAQRKAGTALLPTASPPAQYTADRDVQVIELVLHDGGELIDQLYNTLWSAPAAHAAV